MNMFTVGGRKSIEQFNDKRWKVLFDYYDPFVGTILIPEDVYNNDGNIRSCTVAFLKNANVFREDGTIHNNLKWILEYVLVEEVWYVSIREAEIFC